MGLESQSRLTTLMDNAMAQFNSISVAKQLYKYHESIVRLALVRAGVQESRIHWNCRVANVDIDLAVGRDPACPDCILQVRHSGSSTDQHKKFWREVHELLEMKCSLRPRPVNISIVFEDAVKEALFTAEQALFDAVIRIPQRPYGNTILAKRSSLSAGLLLRLSKEDIYAQLAEYTNPQSPSLDSQFADAVAGLSSELRSLLSSSNTALTGMWDQVSSILSRTISGLPCSVDSTKIKRGLAKLLVFEEPARRAVVDSIINSRPLPQAFDYAIALGLAKQTKTIRGTACIVSDNEMADAVRGLGADRTMATLKDAPLAQIEKQYLLPIREAATSSAILDAIVDNQAQLCKPIEMRRLMDMVFEDPSRAASSLGALTATTRHWLVEGVMTLARSASGLNQGYGFTELAQDAGAPELVTGWVIISDYCTRHSDLPDKLKNKLANGMADRLRALKLPSGNYKDAAIRQAEHILETRLIPYREFDPVGSLIKVYLDARGDVSYEVIPRFKTAIAEYIDANAATIKLLKVSKGASPPRVIMWQSPNKNSRDKQKEFCGRIAMTRISWSSSKNLFARRQLGTAVFVADGAWTASEKTQLLRFGFDAVISPLALTAMDSIL